MKLAVFLLALTLLPVAAPAAPSQTLNSADTITVTRIGNGCDITLPADKAKTLTDQIWLVVDGKSEGFGGADYDPERFPMPLRYTASISSDLDDQVKAILKAQGLPVRANVTTYRISAGINIHYGGSGTPGGVGGGIAVPYNPGTYIPDNVTVSKSLRFRHESNILSYTQLPSKTYAVGEKIPIFEAVALDSSVTTSGILGQSVEKQNQLPHDLLHRIIIQVQFVPKKTP